MIHVGRLKFIVAAFLVVGLTLSFDFSVAHAFTPNYLVDAIILHKAFFMVVRSQPEKLFMMPHRPTA
jgi:hypothetical protein